MTSRTSCFNRAIFRRALRRTAPLWILYLVFWIAALPVQLLVARSGSSPAVSAQYTILTAAYAGCGVVSFVYGLATAWLIFNWLFRSRSAYFYASLPVRRQTVFTTQYCAGLLIGLLPNLIVCLLTMAAAASLGLPQPWACLQWLGANCLGYLFFYSFAVLMCMVVGQVAAMPIFYLVFNCAVYVLDKIVHALLEAFVYGMPESGGSVAMRFSPLICFLEGGVQPRSIYVYNGETAVYDTVGYGFQGWQYLLILGAVGVLFAVLAFFLYRSREMELCGDVIAVRALRPCFLYLFTIGCSFVLGYFILFLLGAQSLSSNFPLVLTCLLAGAFLGYFAARMMLQKTLRVFSDGWWGYFVCCAVILIVFGSARLDIFGYSGRLPDTDEIASVRVMTYRDDTVGSVTDPAVIAQTTALQKYLLDNQPEVERQLRHLRSSDSYGQSFYLEYTLKNGKQFTRKYTAAVTAETQSDPESLIGRFSALYNAVPVVLSRSSPAWELSARNFSYCSVSGSTDADGSTYDSVDLNSREAYALFTDCILPDIEDGTLGQTEFRTTGSQSKSDPYVSVSFDLTDAFGVTAYYSFTVSQEASRTLAYLDKLGFRPFADS